MASLLMLVACVATVRAQVLVSFEQTGAAGGLASSYPIDFINDSIAGITLTASSNLDTAVLALGSGATAGNAAGSLGFASAGAAATLNAAIIGNIYQSFTLTPSTGFMLNVSGVTFNADASSATSTFNFDLLCSVTGFTEFDSLGTVSVVDGAAASTTIDTSGISGLQGVSSSVEFRIYLNRSVGTGTAAYYADDAVNNGLFSINGTVEAIPEPSTYGLLSLAAVGLGAHVIRRRRR